MKRAGRTQVKSVMKPKEAELRIRKLGTPVNRNSVSYAPEGAAPANNQKPTHSLTIGSLMKLSTTTIGC